MSIKQMVIKSNVLANILYIRLSKNLTPEKTNTYDTPKEQLTPQLTPKSTKQPKIDTSQRPSDLAEVVAVWPELPEHTKLPDIRAKTHANTPTGLWLQMVRYGG